MQKLSWFLTLAIAVISVGVFGQSAHADPVRWDSHGWVMLGERTVNGRVDKDVIPVGRYDGKYSKLTVVVENSELEMLEMKIRFADGTEYKPAVTGFYRADQRTRVIEMPPGESVINTIMFRYRNIRGGGDAKVQVWGFKMAPPAPPPVRRYQWDTNGWQMLGEKFVDYTANGTADHDRIDVGAYEGRFSKLSLVVDDADMDLQSFRIEFADRTEFKPALRYRFGEGQRTREIQLPPGEQLIRKIDLRYTPTRNGGRARVQVWGFKIAPPPPPPARFTWNDRGWTMLGEQIVDGHRRADHDTIRVGRAEGKFSQLTVVVQDSDLEMISMVVHLRHGQEFTPNVAMFFRENTRTRVIDLPGDRDRTIESIDFTYKNVPGEGKARVQVWAK